MVDHRLLKAGIAGTAVVAVCCLTPALVVLLGALGLSGGLARLDGVLLPALALFAGLTAYALILRARRRRSAAHARTGPRGPG